MVRIRLTRVGRKHLPFYRIVVCPQRSPRDSKVNEFIGTYSPIEKTIDIKKDRAEHWLSVGAQPSDTVKRLFIKQGILPEEKKKTVFNKKPGKKAQERAQAAE